MPETAQRMLYVRRWRANKKNPEVKHSTPAATTESEKRTQTISGFQESALGARDATPETTSVPVLLLVLVV